MRHSDLTAAAVCACGWLLALVPAATPATAQMTLDWHTIDCGGHTFSTEGSLSLGGSVGQPDAGTVSGDSYVLYGGFWLGGEIVSDVLENTPLGPDTTPLAYHALVGLPNPFQERTDLQLDLPESMPVRISIFDHSGRMVKRLQNGPLASGRHRLSWNGSNGSGQRVASGVYVMRVRAGSHESLHRLIVVR